MQGIILEITANAMDILVLAMLFTRRLLPKYTSRYPTLIFMCLGWLIESVPAIWDIPFYPTEIIMTVLCLLYVFVFRQGRICHKVFWVFISMSLIFAVALTVGTAISFISGTASNEIFTQNNFPLRVLYIVIVNIIKFTLFYLISYSKRKAKSNSKALAICMMIPIVSTLFGIWLWTLFFNAANKELFNNIVLIISASYLLINIFAFLFYEILEKDAEEKMYLAAKQSQYETMEQYTEQIKQTNHEIRVWQHDMKQHLNCMEELLKKGEIDVAVKYFEKFTDSVKGSFLKINTGNYIADAVLSTKISSALDKGIDIDCKASLPEHLPINDVDFCSILSNILENALEASRKVADHPFVRCNIEKIKNQLIIIAENSSNGKYIIKDGVFESIKEKGLHGIGLRHTQSIVERYDGICTINAEENIFKITISIPLKIE